MRAKSYVKREKSEIGFPRSFWPCMLKKERMDLDWGSGTRGKQANSSPPCHILKQNLPSLALGGKTNTDILQMPGSPPPPFGAQSSFGEREIRVGVMVELVRV